jgi:DNA polymerase-1
VDLDTDTVHSFADQPGHRPISEGLAELAAADMTVWHNGIKFDIHAIRKVYPTWKPKGIVRDSMLTASIIWPKNPTLFDIDRKLVKKGKLAGNLMGSHSLMAWGQRVGEWKGEYTDSRKAQLKALNPKHTKEELFHFTWGEWNQEMHDYCEQDVRATAKLWRRILAELQDWQATMPKTKTLECIDLEHEVAWIVARQELNGVGFDREAAVKLLAQLTQQQHDYEAKLMDVFPPKVVKLPFVPKKSNKTKGWIAGVQVWKEKTIPFKPSSRQQVTERLLEMGAVFTERNDSDKGWKIDGDILRALPFEEAHQLADLFDVSKRIGTLSSGRGSLMNYEVNGRIHGRCDSNGTVTGRAAHSKPNVNLPKVKKGKDGNILYGAAGGWGYEFRQLFRARKGMVMCGTDADSLEARVEAGFTVKYDGGAYRDMILSGNKEDGTDLHTVNMKALLSVKKGVTRDIAKTTKYAWTYGAGDPKLGQSVGGRGPKDVLARLGKKVRAMLLAASPGLAALVKDIEKMLQKRSFLWGVDGRKLVIRSSHAALNTLFQSTGSIIFKKAMVLCDMELSGVLPSVIGTQGPEVATRYVPGTDYEQVLFVHDELQHECRPEIKEIVGQAMCDGIRKAGEHFRFPCPMAGNSDFGMDWASTH